MHIQFCGAAGEVTGSCHKIDIESTTLLVDCGLFQGDKYAEDKNYDPFPFNAADIDAVILTHAHLDHCGRLPKLINQGFRGKIYATDATRDLTALILLDAAGIMNDEAERHDHPPLYTEEDVITTMERFAELPYNREVRVAPGVTTILHNAGHILGSSFVELRGEGKRVIFSGDIGNYPVPLLPEPEDLPPVDVLVMESTYGDRTHGDYSEGVKILEQAIIDTVKDRGVLLVPAFSLERTQELLTVIDQALGAKRVPEISAYLDGPLGIKVCRVYDKYDDYFKPEIQALEKKESDQSVLQFPHLTYTETSEQSKMINDVAPPKMIIAGSGMMQGGRILHHLKRYLSDTKTRICIVGHQVGNSLGRRLLDGANSVTIHGEEVAVKAQIIPTHSFSSHMDQEQMVEWLVSSSKPPKTVFLVHGDEEARPVLAKRLQEKMTIDVKLPKYQEGFTIGHEQK